MSLVGTRPPTVDEWDKYELHHRARLATKPGLTGMWQVSGRSNITDLALTKGEKKMIKDMHNNPPVGKYLIQPGSFPDYREIIKSSKEELYQRILQGKEEASLCLERMNAGDWCSDYRSYENWKKDFQDYLKLLYSDLWYENGDIIIIYHYIVKNLPAHLKKEDMNLMKRLLRKLLFCKLVTQLDEKMLKQYYKAFKSQTNNKETVKKSKDINVCGNIKQCEFARGIAQGLPQSYFLGNIYMIIVSRIFRNEFSGASYFYVDDSVIFTNDVIETEFKEQLKEINKQIEAKEREILQKHSEENLKIYPCKTKEFYESYLYGVHVHLEEKSAYTRLDSLDEGEVYLKSISRQMSQAGSDFFKMHSDEENSYRKIDNYFEEAVRSKHANDSAAEIRKRSELNYLDTSMRELVAEVSEAHGADRIYDNIIDIYKLIDKTHRDIFQPKNLNN